jgi:hypothetical protein
MSLGEILDRTFQIYRSRFAAFAVLSGCSALLLVTVRLMNELFWKMTPFDGPRIFGVVNVGWVFYLLAFGHASLLFRFLSYPPITYLASGEYLLRRCSFADAVRTLKKRWLANVGLALLQMGFLLILPEISLVLLLAGIMGLATALNVETAAYGPIWSPSMLMLVLGGAALFYLMTSWFGLAWCASRIEGLSAWRALGRSRRLSTGARRQIFAAQLMPEVLWLALFIAMAVSLRFSIEALGLGGVRYLVLMRAYETAALVGQWAIGTLVGPLFPIALTVFYYDQRIRKEGFDIEWMMAAAGMSAAVDAIPVAVESGAGEIASVPVEGAGA